jgi:hypothetical protein
MDEPSAVPVMETVGRSPPFAVLVPASMEVLEDADRTSDPVLLVLLAVDTVALVP